jgi:hypothetical protein
LIRNPFVSICIRFVQICNVFLRESTGFLTVPKLELLVGRSNILSAPQAAISSEEWTKRRRQPRHRVAPAPAQSLASGGNVPTAQKTSPSAEDHLPKSLYFAESDVIIGVVRARSVHEVGYGHKWDWEA